jgi:phage tail sheath protein FI
MPVEPRKASFGLTFLLGALVFCLFIALASWWLRLTPAPESYDETRAAKRAKNLSDLHVTESQQLKNYAWVDKDKGLVRIPLERALALVLPELQARQVRPSTVAVENPYPYGLQPAAPVPASTGTAAAAGAAPQQAAQAATSPAASTPTPTEPMKEKVQ